MIYVLTSIGGEMAAYLVFIPIRLARKYNSRIYRWVPSRPINTRLSPRHQSVEKTRVLCGKCKRSHMPFKRNDRRVGGLIREVTPGG